jgi:hypothetical protein
MPFKAIASKGSLINTGKVITTVTIKTISVAKIPPIQVLSLSISQHQTVAL